MQNEQPQPTQHPPHQDTTAPTTPGTTEPPKPTLARRVAQVGLSFINPFSDLMVIYRTGIKPIGIKLNTLRELLKRSAAAQEALSFDQAVQRSGQSVEQLLRTFRRRRTVWWSVMVVTGALVIGLSLMLIAAHVSLPLVTFIRALVTDLFLASLSFFGFANVLNANVRLWQLATRRVTVQEGGTFQDYRAENPVWSHVLSMKAAY